MKPGRIEKGREGRRIDRRSPSAGTLVLTVLLGFSLTGFGGPLVEKTLEGNRLYEEGEYGEALVRYTDAQLEDPERLELHYNIGNVLYRQKKFAEAQGEFEEALSAESMEVVAHAHFNNGNALFRQAVEAGDLELAASAIEEYKKVLEIDSADRDAKYNIEFIRKHIEQKKEEQEQQKNCSGEQGEEGEKKEGGEHSEGEEGQKEGAQEEKQAGGEKEQESKPQSAEQEREPPQPGESAEQQAGKDLEEIGREEASRILDALEAEEVENQRERQKKRRAESGQVDKDW